MMLTKAQASGMMKAVAEFVREHMASALAPLMERLKVVETRDPLAGLRDALKQYEPDLALAAAALIDPPKPGEPGKSVTVDDLRPLVEEAVAALPKPENGKSPTPEELAPIVDEAVARAVSALPKPKDGEPGKDADPAFIVAEIEKAVAALPRPKDGEPGRSMTVADVEPLIAEQFAKAVSALPPAKDGVGLADAMINKSGNLVLTMTDGRLKELGRVDGEPGKPGADGLGFDDLDVTYDGERGVTLCFVRGEHKKSFNIIIPAVLYRGIFKEGEPYTTGDLVTWAGSLWHCKEATTDKPGEGSASWTLATKKGRDGRSVAPDDMKPLIEAAVEKAVAAAFAKRDRDRK